MKENQMKTDKVVEKSGHNEGDKMGMIGLKFLV